MNSFIYMENSRTKIVKKLTEDTESKLFSKLVSSFCKQIAIMDSFIF
jgi:hypothetical protein